MEDVISTKTRLGVRALRGQEFSEVVDEYGYYYDENEKKRVFGVTGRKNIYEEIVSHKDTTDIKYIKEVLLGGGAPELTDDMFGDVSRIQGDLLTHLNCAELGRDMFNSLPKEVRELYNNDLFNFAKNYNEEEVRKLIDKTFISKKEVKPNEEV